MIGKHDLANVAQRGWLVHEAEQVEPRAPAGSYALPQEWKEKLTPYPMGPTMAYEVEDVDLAGAALIGFKDGDVILDQGYYGRLDLWERNWGYFQMARECLRLPAIEIECAMVLASVWNGNYFHWTLDELPKLEGAEVYTRETGRRPMIVAPGRSPGFAIETLQQSGMPFRLVDDLHLHVKRLVICTARRAEGRIAASAVDYLRGMTQRVNQWWEPSGTSDRLYITRRGAATRRVTNESRLAEKLLERGFAICQLETMSVAEQQQRFAGAEWVIGPHGAGLANLAWVWSPAETKVLELVAPQYSNPCCWMVGEAAGVGRYGYIMGEAVGKEDMSIDLATLDWMMERMEA